MGEIKIAVFKSDEGNHQNSGTALMLNNGDVIVIEDKVNPRYYMVTTFGEAKSNACTLTDLHTGARAFTEHASRSTTIGRLLNHLTLDYPNLYDKFRQYKAGEYLMNIELFGDGLIKKKG